MLRRTDDKAGRYGFTLVEILVVVAILGILTAILFPVFATAREKSRASACISNYHQVGLAIHMYSDDFDGYTPPDGGSFSGLIADCRPYLHTDAVFSCPDDFDRVKEGRAGSYRVPSLYQGLPLACGWQDPYNSNAPADPVSTTLAYEAEQDFAYSPVEPTYRHSDGTQLLRFDGHVRWIKGYRKDADD